MKTKLLILLTVFAMTNSGFAQSIKDFYIPNGKTKSVFYKPDPNTVKKAPVQMLITYTKRSENEYKIKEESKVNNNLASTLIREIILESDKIKIISITSTSLYGASNQQKHNPALIYIQLPPEGNKSTWNYINRHDEKIMCSSEWVIITKDNAQVKALKVIRDVYEDGVKVDWATIIEYYIKDIGLYKITSGENIDSQILDFQE